MKELSPDLILQSTNVGFLCTDRRGRIVNINAAAARTLGVTKDEAVGRFIGDFSHGAWRAFRTIIRTGKPQAGIRIHTSGGAVIADRNPVFDGDDVIGVVSVFKELSRYEETAKELQSYRELAKELDAVINSSYDGLYITDGKANTLFFNKAYLRISGLKADDVAGKNMRELVQSGTINRSVTLEVLGKRKSVTIMQEFSNGRTAIVTGNPIYDEAGGIVRVVSNVRDITELNELRGQLQETRSLARKYRDELTMARLEGVARDAVVFRSAAMGNCIDLAVRVSRVASPVLLTGGSGVGKGMLARLIHNLGIRKEGPFIHVNCGAIPAGLMESELFGYQKGAFTSASEEGKPGLFELADKGTLFLDEIGEIPQDLQVKLLKALEGGEVQRIGATRGRKADVRIVAASNRDLKAMTGDGRFREDLYFRLNVFPIHIPPLRERPEDVHPLVDRILADLNRKYRKGKRIRPEALDRLSRYPFPGNVREMQNIVERAFILSDGKWIEAGHLPPEVQDAARARPAPPAAVMPGAAGDVPGDVPGDGLDAMLDRVEKAIIERCRSRCGSTHEMAKALGINQSTVVRKMKKHGIGPRPGPPG